MDLRDRHNGCVYVCVSETEEEDQIGIRMSMADSLYVWLDVEIRASTKVESRSNARGRWAWFGGAFLPELLPLPHSSRFMKIALLACNCYPKLLVRASIDHPRGLGGVLRRSSGT
jgi:hypothetical protein